MNDRYAYDRWLEREPDEGLYEDIPESEEQQEETVNEQTTRRYTASGEYVVFHGSQAGSPELFDDAWYFEPADYPYGDVFSDAYETPEAAVQACEAWEVQAAREAEAELQAELEETEKVEV